MRNFKNILLSILIILISFSSVSAFFGKKQTPEEKCIEYTDVDVSQDSIVKFLSDTDRLKYVYCITWVLEWNSTSTYETRKDLIEDAEWMDAHVIASREEKTLLDRKKELLEVDKKKLSYWEIKLLVELWTWIDCSWKVKPWEWTDIITCTRDLRMYEYSLTEEDDSMFWWIWTTIDVYKAWIVNGFLFFMSYLTSQTAFGYVKFDQLPDLPYEAVSDMFDTTTVYWIINSFALMLLGFTILYYFLKVWTWRDWDSHKLFLIKVWIILMFVAFFPLLYKWLQSLLVWFQSSLIDSVNWLIDIDSKSVIDWIRMDVFDIWWLTTLTWWFIFILFNIVLLIIISFIVVIRDIFLLFLLNVFFLTAVWFLWWSLKQDNIFEWGGMWNKITKKLVLWMFWIISAFVTAILTIFIFQVLTVMLATIPSIEVAWLSIVWNLSSFSIDAFIYLLLLVWILFFWRNFLIKWVYAVVSDFLMDIFFPQSKWDGWYGAFWKEMSDWYSEVKMWLEDLKQNNAVFKDVQDSVSPSLNKEWLFNEKDRLSSDTKEILNDKQFADRESMKVSWNNSNRSTEKLEDTVVKIEDLWEKVLNEGQSSMRKVLTATKKVITPKNVAKVVTWVSTLGTVTNRWDLWKLIKTWVSLATGLWDTYVSTGNQKLWHIDSVKAELKKFESERNSLDPNDLKNSSRIRKLDTYISKLKNDKELSEWEIKWEEKPKEVLKEDIKEELSKNEANDLDIKLEEKEKWKELSEDMKFLKENFDAIKWDINDLRDTIEDRDLNERKKEVKKNTEFKKDNNTNKFHIWPIDWLDNDKVNLNKTRANTRPDSSLSVDVEEKTDNKKDTDSKVDKIRNFISDKPVEIVRKDEDVFKENFESFEKWLGMKSFKNSRIFNEILEDEMNNMGWDEKIEISTFEKKLKQKYKELS
jgi:hypothetical protein